jgi:uncharacterized GH25 family protein
MWLNASDYTPEIYPKYGARANVYFGYGHHYPVDNFLAQDHLDEFFLVTSDGNKEKLNPNNGGFLATEVNFKHEGIHIITASLKPGFYTMYVDKGEIHHKLGSKTGLRGIILSLYYEQYTKCLINVGEIEDDSFSKPVGHKLEIIPLKNPYKLHGCGGHFLPVKVLFEGKPARYCEVYATYMGFSTGDDFAYATSTDGNGIARIRLTHWGPWLVKAEVKLPAPDDLKDECNELHYTATLTFEVP